MPESPSVKLFAQYPERDNDANFSGYALAFDLKSSNCCTDVALRELLAERNSAQFHIPSANGGIYYVDSNEPRGISMFHMRKSKSDVPKPRWMTAIFDGSCRCGKRIKKGDQLYRDEILKLNLCKPCGRNEQNASSSQLSLAEEPSTAQSILDELSRLSALPSPISPNVRERISHLQKELLEDTEHNCSTRELLMKRFPIKDATVRRQSWQGKCSSCNSTIKINEPVYFLATVKQVTCFHCTVPAAIERTFNR